MDLREAEVDREAHREADLEGVVHREAVEEELGAVRPRVRSDLSFPHVAHHENTVILEPHRHAGVFVAKGTKESLLVTRNLVPGDAVYGEVRSMAC